MRIVAFIALAIGLGAAMSAAATAPGFGAAQVMDERPGSHLALVAKKARKSARKRSKATKSATRRYARRPYRDDEDYDLRYILPPNLFFGW
jgi:hypothetical protein